MICDLNVDFDGFYLKIRKFRDNFVTFRGLDVAKCRLVRFPDYLKCLKSHFLPFSLHDKSYHYIKYNLSTQNDQFSIRNSLRKIVWKMWTWQNFQCGYLNLWQNFELVVVKIARESWDIPLSDSTSIKCIVRKVRLKQLSSLFEHFQLLL